MLHLSDKITQSVEYNIDNWIIMNTINGKTSFELNTLFFVIILS